MKKQILTLIIGMLLGAIITTGIFLILKNNENQGDIMERNGGDFSAMDGNSIGGPGGMMDNMKQDSNSVSESTTTNEI